MRVRTESIQFKADVKLLEYVEQKLSKLEHYFDRILDVSVKLRLENSGQVRDKVVEVKVKVPGTTIFAKEEAKTFESSTDEVVDNLKRQIKKYKEKIRVKS